MPQTVVFSSTVILTNAQIKALPTTPFELVGAPGSGKFLNVVQVILIPNFTAGSYTNIGAEDSYITPVYEGDSEFMGYLLNVDAGTVLTDFLGSADNIVKTFLPLPQTNSYGGGAGSITLAAVSNKAVQLYMDNAGQGNLTGGNVANTLKVETIFTVITI